MACFPPHRKRCGTGGAGKWSENALRQVIGRNPQGRSFDFNFTFYIEAFA
jgi:hypothetical protein